MIRFCRAGLKIDDTVVPMHAASVHYWHLHPDDWKPCLEAVRALGARLVDTYVPWAVHEVEPGELELGASDPQRDLGRFLRLAADLDLYAIVRPGPHINAELTYFGLPERIVWDPACQARSPQGNPVVLPMVPKMFPVPSYASTAFLDEVTRYFHLLGATLAPLCHPHGPIVLVQVDNEGALYFRDGVYDQDYHPDAINQYRSFLRRKYGSPLPYPDTEQTRIAELAPPKSFDATSTNQLAFHLDWAQFQEQLLAKAFSRFAEALRTAGLDNIPTTHNFPLAENTTPLNAARVGHAVDMIGLDYYGPASERARSDIARRTSGLALRSEALDTPAFACEMGAGFPPFFPPLSTTDSKFTLLAALAYGLRGFNIYMAVERDRWIGAPIDAYGTARPFAAFYERLFKALETCRFHQLQRRTPVRLVVPRIEQRLARILHAFGPVSGAALSVMGHGAREGAAEFVLDDLDHGLVVPAQHFARAIETALDQRGVPYAVVGGEDREASLPGAKWVICATSGAIAPSLRDSLREAAKEGALVTVGPVPPTRDDAFLPIDDAIIGMDLLATTDRREIDMAVAHCISERGLHGDACAPAAVHLTLHHDPRGDIRVAFIINGSNEEAEARATVTVDDEWTDMLDGTRFQSRGGELAVPIPRQTVRMLGRGAFQK